jgi:hypothetical protein
MFHDAVPTTQFAELNGSIIMNGKFRRQQTWFLVTECTALNSRLTEENLLDRQDSNTDSTEYKAGMLAITSQKPLFH